MEYSLTNPRTEKHIKFDTFFELMQYLSKVGEVDGWILRILHL